MVDPFRLVPRRWWDPLVRYGSLLPMRHAVVGRVGWRQALGLAWRARALRFHGRDEADIFYSIVIADEYQLRDRRFAPSDVVLDVGAHVGSFGVLAHMLGSRSIVSYEAYPPFHARLARHYAVLDGARAVHAAVVGNDGAAPPRVEHSGIPLDGNTGGGGVVFSGRARDRGGERLIDGNSPAADVPSVPLDEILGAQPEVALLKLDCEGSEYRMLETSRLLGRVRRLVVEFHRLNREMLAAMPDWARPAAGSAALDAAIGRLTDDGFRVARRDAGAQVLVWAERRG